MKNKILLFIIFIPIAILILISNCYAQPGEWTWMHGDSVSGKAAFSLKSAVRDSTR